MTENVKQLIWDAYTFPVVNKTQIGIDIVRKNVKHRFQNVNEQEVWYVVWLFIIKSKNTTCEDNKLLDDYKKGDLIWLKH